MTPQPALGDIARAVIDANLYMTLGTVGADGSPWVTPVYYTAGNYTELYWVSSPETAHSRNIVARPGVSIVIFDSQTPIGKAQAVYMSGVAEKLTGSTATAGSGSSLVAHRHREREPGRPTGFERPLVCACFERRSRRSRYFAP